MLTLEEKYVFRQFVLISPWPGQCNLPSVVKTEAVPLTQSGGTLGCFYVNIMLFQQHYKPLLSGLHRGNRASVEIPRFALEQHRGCSKEKTSGSARQTRWLNLLGLRAVSVLGNNRRKCKVKNTMFTFNRATFKTVSSLYKGTGWAGETSKHGTEAKPAVVSCDVPCRVCACRAAWI